MQTLSHSVPSGTCNPLHAVYALLIPDMGAFFGTIVGKDKTIALVFLAPGDGLNREHRQAALEHPQVSFHVRGDWPRAHAPGDFDQSTVRWGIGNADCIAIWSAPFPEFADEVAEWGITAANTGARFVTIIETTVDRAIEWAKLVRRWKRGSTSLQFFGPESAETV